MSSTHARFVQRAAIVILSAVGAALPQIVTAQSDALLGKWILVPERSKYSGPERYKSMTLTFSKAGGGMTKAVEGVDAKATRSRARLKSSTTTKFVQRPVSPITTPRNGKS